jgi:uncharacterized protein GlcG (DUF336 family)
MDTPKESVQREEIMATATTAASPSFPAVHTRPCDANFFSPVRMDDVWIGSIDISINKAYTTRASDISTKDLAQYLQSGGHFFGIHVSNHGRVMVFAGGIPLIRGRESARRRGSERRFWRAESRRSGSWSQNILNC